MAHEHEADAIQADEDELLAEVIGVLEELVEEEQLELASRRGLTSLATMPLLGALRDPDVTFSDWLVDRPEVVELYLDENELRDRFRRVVARMVNDATPSRHHPELAAAILAAPDDTQAWTVYADWLQEQGDPRGELAALQLGRRAKKNVAAARLKRREEALLARHRRHFFGELPVDKGAEDRVQVSFRNGFFDEVTLSHHADLKTLLELESSRFLRTLTASCRDLDPVGEVLAAHPLPTMLTEVTLGIPVDPYSSLGGSLHLGVAVRGLSRLERLTVSAQKLTVSPLALPALRQLTIAGRRVYLREHAFDALRSLESLDIEAGVLNLMSPLVALFQSPPPMLSVLAIRKVDGTVSVSTVEELPADRGARVHEILPALLASPLASQLRSLALPGDLLDDGDGQALLAAKSNLPKLELLDVGGNGFSREMRMALAAAWPRARAVEERPLEHDEDYADDDEGEDEDENERYDEIDE